MLFSCFTFLARWRIKLEQVVGACAGYLPSMRALSVFRFSLAPVSTPEVVMKGYF